MAIALTEFEGLCGFRLLSQIQGNLKSVPQLSEAIGKDLVEQLLRSNSTNYGPALKAAFAALMKCSKEVLNKSLTNLQGEIEKKTCQTGMDWVYVNFKKVLLSEASYAKIPF